VTGGEERQRAQKESGRKTGRGEALQKAMGKRGAGREF